MRSLVGLVLALAALQGCSGEAGDTFAADAGSGEGSADSGGGCWTEPLGTICPAQPHGASAADCKGSLDGSGFAAGTGLCLPRFAPSECPVGWTETVRGGTSFCLPAAATICAETALQLPAGCEAPGTVCPSHGDWPSEAELRARAPDFDGPIVYVHPDGDAAGDGSRVQPLPLSTSAMRRAEGGILALATGRYVASLRIDRSLALIGGCPSSTTLEAPSASDTLGTLEIAPNGPVEVQDLTVTGDRPGLIVRGSVPFPHRLKAVFVDRALGFGLLADSAQVTEADHLRVAGTRPFADGTMGLGLSVRGGAQLTARSSEVRGNRTIGVLVTEPGSMVRMEDSRIAETLPQESDSRFGRGVNVGSGGRFEGVATTIEGNRSTGLFVTDADSSAEGSGLMIAGTQSDVRTGLFGRGVEVDSEAAFRCAGCVVRDNLDAGVVVDDGGSVLLRGSLIADNAPRTADGRFGRGVMVQGGGRLETSGLVVAGHRDLALYLSDPGSVAQLADTRIEGPTEAIDRLVSIQSEATADLQRVTVAGDATVALYVGTGATVVASDLALAGVGASPLAASARLLEVSGGGAFTASRVTLHAASANGLLVSEPSSGVVVRDARFTSQIPSTSGRAIEVNLGATATLERASLAGFSDAGAAVFGGGSQLTLRDALLAQVAGLAAPARGTGHALAAYDGATLTASRLLLRDVAGACLRLAGEGVAFDLETVAFRRCFVGVNLEVPGLSRELLGEHLRDEQFAENGEDVAFRTLALPEPTTTLEPAP